MKNEKYLKALKTFRQEMIDYIADNWTEEDGEKGMSEGEAALYLGHPVSGMSQEEIDAEVSSIQLAYYTDGPAEFDEIVALYLQMQFDDEPPHNCE